MFVRSYLIQVERSLVLIEKCPSWDVPVFQPAVKEVGSFGAEQCQMCKVSQGGDVWGRLSCTLEWHPALTRRTRAALMGTSPTACTICSFKLPSPHDSRQASHHLSMMWKRDHTSRDWYCTQKVRVFSTLEEQGLRVILPALPAATFGGQSTSGGWPAFICSLGQRLSRLRGIQPSPQHSKDSPGPGLS